MRSLSPRLRCRLLSRSRGFSLIELLVASAVLLIVIVVLLEVISGMTSIWHNSTGAVSNFQAARAAFSTLSRELSRATLESYLDYINNPLQNNKPFGQFRTSLAANLNQEQQFVPYEFARASELHFVCGPAGTTLSSGAASTNPGDAVFFQAPLGLVAAQTESTDKYLGIVLNDVGFYVQYSDLSSSIFPSWLTSFLGVSTHYGYRLVECVEPTENLSVYHYTALGTWNLGWLPPASAASFPVSNTTYSESVLAENVVLLLVRPRLDPQDEETLAPTFGRAYGPTTQNSIISPNYVYDSRAWQPGYSFSATQVESSTYGIYMRNQLPPIIDLAMVCVDPGSIAPLQISSQKTPPSALQPPAGLFVNSANMDADLATFGQQLTANRINYRIFRSTVQIQAAAWANE